MDKDKGLSTQRKDAKTQRGQPQPNSPWPQNRAEAQSAQKNQAGRFFLVFLRALRASARDIPSARFWSRLAALCLRDFAALR